MATSQDAEPEAAGDAAAAPIITRDPRFRAGCKLVRSGRVNEGAIDMFATVLESTVGKYGEVSIESAPAYHEYGHALLLAGLLEQEANDLKEEKEDEENDDDDDQKPAAVDKPKDEQSKVNNEKILDDGNEVSKTNNDNDKKKGTVDQTEENGKDDASGEDDDGKNDDGKNDNDENDNGAGGDEASAGEAEEESDDIHLALEMMENSYAIMDAYVSAESPQKYHAWTTEQMPRVLLHIGEALSALGRHADAADTYTRFLAYREETVEKLEQAKANSAGTGGASSPSSLTELEAYRKLTDANVMVAEALLLCPDGEDVVTTETKVSLVKAAERMDYIRGYYHKAQDAMQSTCTIMAEIAAREDVSSELKEDVCFSSIGLMAVGERIAEYEQVQLEKQQQEESTEPAKKRAKRSS